MFLIRLLSKGLLALFVVVGLCGCGGGGSNNGGSGGAPQIADGADAAKGIISFAQGTGISNHTRSNEPALRPGVMRLGLDMLSRKVSAARATWYYDADLGLYYTVVIDTYYRLRINLNTGPGTGGNAGYIDATLTDDVPYPVAGHLDFSITKNGATVGGAMDLVLNDPQYNSYRVVANYGLNRPYCRISYDLAYNFGVITGGASATDGGNVVAYRNLVSTNNSIRFDWTINSLSGQCAVGSDQSGFVSINSSHGTYRLEWDSSYQCQWRLPDGSVTYAGYLYDL